MKKESANYVDGFVLMVPKENVAAYKKMARIGAKTWLKHGALNYKECMIEDVEPEGVMLNFPKLVKAKSGETIWFSYIEFKNKKHRDQVNAKVMKEMDEQAKKYKEMQMPFDMKRMAYAGFKVEVSA